MASPGNLLVIGGGLGGISAIVGLRKVDKTTEITLVEPKEYMEVAWAAYRSPFEEWVAEGSVLDLAAFCKANSVTHLRALVVTMDCSQAQLDDGTVVPFNVAVVASGATTQWPGLGRGPPLGNGSRAGRLEELKIEGERLMNAGSILVVGGGLIGTELAGDLKGYASKAGRELKITLVHSGEHLCPEFSPAAAAMVKDKLEKMGVTVILNDKAKSDDKGKMVLEKAGTAIEANEVVMTTGLGSCNSFMNALSTDALNDRGFVNTDDYFRVKGTDGKVFSIGDCCTTLPNSGSQILNNIKVLGNNIKITLDAVTAHQLKPELPGLKKFELGPEVYLATIGPNDGVMFYSSTFWTQYMLPWLKNSTMFFFRVKSELGL
jgi:apoptosis-inducing factor 2